MSELIRIQHVEPLHDHWLRLSFSDGAVKEVDVGTVLAQGGVFGRIRDERSIFERVRANPEIHTIEWPGEVDLDAQVLYGPFEPEGDIRIERRTVRGPPRRRREAPGEPPIDARCGAGPVSFERLGRHPQTSQFNSLG